MRNYLKVFIACLWVTTLSAYDLNHTVKKIDANKASLSLTFNLKPKEYLYKEGFTATVNSPNIKLSAPTASRQPASFFDEVSKKQKEGYKEAVTFNFSVEKEPDAAVHNPIFHLHFLTNTSAEPQEKVIELPFNANTQKQEDKKANASITAPPVQEKSSQATVPSCEAQQPSLFGTLVQKITSWIKSTAQHAKGVVSSLFSSTGSRIVRLGAALLLGILLSLTPCIYPMIPITIGILQASGTPSPIRNFLLALSYTLGISTTFAILGFIASIGSCVFGELQGSPWVIIPLALLLIYFALSMFDIVNFYIPKFLQPKAGHAKGGSFLSAYTFGAISGTIASPCLSPGLVLILNYVASKSMQSIAGYLEGFLLLFIFGIGSSLPLLIIGTFSSSLHILPKAGMWMVEIKKLVGLMLIFMAFYHLSHLETLLPWHLFVWVIVLTLFVLGIYYFASIQPLEKKALRYYKNFMGTALIVAACIMLVQGQKALIDYLYPQQISSAWLHNYDEARTRAQAEKKLLFIDVGATYCSACKVLDQRIFAQDQIKEALSHFVQLKVDADVHKDAYEKLKQLYGMHITGFPTYLIVDPVNEKVVKIWSIEIDQMSISAIVDELGKTRNI